jgi:hypothetical protein
MHWTQNKPILKFWPGEPPGPVSTLHVKQWGLKRHSSGWGFKKLHMHHPQPSLGPGVRPGAFRNTAFCRERGHLPLLRGRLHREPCLASLGQVVLSLLYHPLETIVSLYLVKVNNSGAKQTKQNNSNTLGSVVIYRTKTNLLTPVTPTNLIYSRRCDQADTKDATI